MTWRELFDPHSVETRGMRAQARVFEFAVVGCVIAAFWEWVPAIARNPAVVAPLGLARYVDISMLLDVRAAALIAAAGTALSFVGVSGKWRGAYLSALVLLHLQHVARYCMGKTSHGAHFAGLALLASGLAAIAFADDSQRRKAALGLTVMLFGAGYTCAGVVKLVASGPGWIDGHHLWLWIEEKRIDAISAHGSAQLNRLQEAVLGSEWLGTMLLSFGLISELCAWLAWWRAPRPWVFTALIAMHVGIQASLGIGFVFNEILLAVLVLPIARWVDHFHPLAPATASARLSVAERRK
jgi:hypothetical protein